MAQCLLTSTLPSGVQVQCGGTLGQQTVPGSAAYLSAFQASINAVPPASQSSGSALANAQAAGLAATVLTLPVASNTLTMQTAGSAAGTGGTGAFAAAVAAGIIMIISG